MKGHFAEISLFDSSSFLFSFACTRPQYTEISLICVYLFVTNIGSKVIRYEMKFPTEYEVRSSEINFLPFQYEI